MSASGSSVEGRSRSKSSGKVSKVKRESRSRSRSRSKGKKRERSRSEGDKRRSRSPVKKERRSSSRDDEAKPLRSRSRNQRKSHRSKSREGRKSHRGSSRDGNRGRRSDYRDRDRDRGGERASRRDSRDRDRDRFRGRDRAWGGDRHGVDADEAWERERDRDRGIQERERKERELDMQFERERDAERRRRREGRSHGGRERGDSRDRRDDRGGSRDRDRNSGRRDQRERDEQRRPPSHDGAKPAGRWDRDEDEQDNKPAPSNVGALLQSAGARGKKGRDRADEGGHHEWGGKQEEEKEEEEKKVQAANFGLSGALAKDAATGNVYKGMVMKWSEPEDARPPTKKWRFYVFKDDEVVQTLHLHRQSAYLIGREKKIADVCTAHPSCSGQHAVLQFRLKELVNEKEMKTTRNVRPYIMDLNSTNGTSLNGEKIEGSRYYELLEKDVLKFGNSSREYVLLHDASAG